MAEIERDKTTNLQLIKPKEEEFYSIQDFNGNSDLIDNWAGEVNTHLNENTQNIAQLSNPSLLINEDFQIWQRGTTFGRGYNNYTADRWLKRTQGVVEKVNNGIKISRKSNEEETYIRQYMESEYLYNLRGKTLTLSCEIGEIVGTAGLMFYANGGTRLGIKNFTTTGIHSITFTIPQDIDLTLRMMPQIALNNNSSQDTYVVIKWIKLEIGSRVTPFVPRPYGEELALCKRYFRHIYGGNYGYVGIVIMTSSTLGYAMIPVSNMRIYPTLSYSGSLRLFKGASGLTEPYAVIALKPNQWSSEYYIAEVNLMDNTCFKQGDVCALIVRDGAYIDLDAEIY